MLVKGGLAECVEEDRLSGDQVASRLLCICSMGTQMMRDALDGGSTVLALSVYDVHSDELALLLLLKESDSGVKLSATLSVVTVRVDNVGGGADSNAELTVC